MANVQPRTLGDSQGMVTTSETRLKVQCWHKRKICQSDAPSTKATAKNNEILFGTGFPCTGFGAQDSENAYQL